jgi:hypothetical protein
MAHGEHGRRGEARIFFILCVVYLYPVRGSFVARQGIHINRKDRQDNDLLPVGHSFAIDLIPLTGNNK